MPDKYMVKQTVLYSDGTETVINYTQNPNQAEIESQVAEMVADHTPVTASEPQSVVGETTASETPVEEVVKKNGE